MLNLLKIILPISFLAQSFLFAQSQPVDTDLLSIKFLNEYIPVSPIDKTYIDELRRRRRRNRVLHGFLTDLIKSNWVTLCPLLKAKTNNTWDCFKKFTEKWQVKEVFIPYDLMIFAFGVHIRIRHLFTKF